MNHHLISLMIFFPMAGAIVQPLIPMIQKKSLAVLHRWVALGASLTSGIIGIVLVAMMRTQVAELQSVEAIPWIGAYAISYEVGVDGLNALLVLLISVVFPLLIAAEWRQRLGPCGMHGLFLVLQSAMLGAVCAQDLFLLFFFWALSALPFYFLLGIWGGRGRETAAFRGIVSSSVGNAFLFAAIVLVYYSVDPHTFLIGELAVGKLSENSFLFFGQELSVPLVAFALLAIGLALRAPIWPLHGWFTSAAEEAPASVFVALSAVSVPVAVYIFVRVGYSLFPSTTGLIAEGVVAVGVINLIIGGICAVAQRGVKSVLAFLCMSETGLILVGVGSLESAGVVGAVYQEFVLGLGLAGLGLFSGMLIERQESANFRNENGEAELGGLSARAPGMAVVVGVVIASLLGFPGLGGFIGRALLLIGAYAVYPWVVIFAGGALLLAVYCLFTMYRFIFLGQGQAKQQSFSDLNVRERLYLLPLIGALLIFGLYPKPLVELVRPTVSVLLSTIK